MKIITIETLKAFLDELNKKYGTEFYTKTECDERYQQKGDAYTKTESDERYQPKGESSGGNADYAELARRIPSWQWKVTMPQTVNQTVTATVNGQTYTSDFYAQQGSNVTFSVKADPGYVAGSLSATSATLAKDLTVTVTAVEVNGVKAGSKTFEGSGGELTVPKKVQVLKWTWNKNDVYIKLMPNDVIGISLQREIPMGYGGNYPIGSSEDGLAYAFSDICINGNSKRGIAMELGRYSFDPLVISWSNEINEHAIDYDLTK